MFIGPVQQKCLIFTKSHSLLKSVWFLSFRLPSKPDQLSVQVGSHRHLSGLQKGTQQIRKHISCSHEEYLKYVGMTKAFFEIQTFVIDAIHKWPSEKCFLFILFLTFSIACIVLSIPVKYQFISPFINHYDLQNNVKQIQTLNKNNTLYIHTHIT